MGVDGTGVFPQKNVEGIFRCGLRSVVRVEGEGVSALSQRPIFKIDHSRQCLISRSPALLLPALSNP